MMTEKDRRLLREAEDTHWSDWGLISSLEKQADTEEGRDAIRHEEIRKAHLEEFHCTGSM